MGSLDGNRIWGKDLRGLHLACVEVGQGHDHLTQHSVGYIDHTGLVADGKI